MFRAPKNQKKRTVVMSRQEDDDEEEESSPVVIVQRKIAKKRPRPTIRSFQVEDELDEKMERKKKTKRKGLGFGGVALPVMEEELKDTSHNNLYDKNALEALKIQQKYRQSIREHVISPKKSIDSNQDESFMALNDSHVDPISVLNGEDAVAALDEEDNEKPPLNTSLQDTDDDVELSSDWEAQVTKRAGLSASSRRTMPTSQTTFSTIKSVADLQHSITNTISVLVTQDEDLKAAHNRRQVEVHAAEADVQKHASALDEAGEALEYYQELRLELSSWVGALRDLRRKLVPIQDALLQTQLQSKALWRQWEDDVVAVLSPPTVIGRQPVPTSSNQDSFVDEFGRDVKSQHIIARERRYHDREKARQEGNQLDGTDPDQLLTFAQRDEVMQRREALQLALKVALEDMDEEYGNLNNLLQIFKQWSTKYGQDYQSCHAAMSLADLASVLLNVDLCSTHYPLSMSGTSFPHLQSLKDVPSSTILEETPLYRSIDKVLIPILEQVIPHYNLHSTKESKCLCRYVCELEKLLPPGSILMNKMKYEIREHLVESLHELAIPIMNGPFPTTDKVVVEAMTYATRIQVTRIQTMCSNIFTWWVPLLGDDQLVEPVLDFIASSFLHLISSIGEQAKFEFAKVWSHLQSWADQPEFMVAMAPLHAAASAYEVT